MTLSVLLTIILAMQSAGQVPRLRPVISVTLSSISSDAKLGSKVRLKIVVTNTSDHEMLLAWSVSRVQAEILNRFEVRDEKGNAAIKTKYYGAFTGERIGDYPLEEYRMDVGGSPVKPGGSVSEEVVLNRLYELDKPGKYTIQVEHEDPETKIPIKSNTIAVTVTP